MSIILPFVCLVCFGVFCFWCNYQSFRFTVVQQEMKWQEFKHERLKCWRDGGSNWHLITSGNHVARSGLHFLLLKDQIKKLKFFLTLLPAPTPPLLPQAVIPYFQKSDSLFCLQAFLESSFWNHFFSYSRIGTAQHLCLHDFVIGFTKVLERVAQLGGSTDVFGSLQSVVA